MKRNKLILLLALLTLDAVAASAQAQDTRAAIEAQNKKFVQAVEKGEARAIANLYTVNAIVMPANSDSVKGREAIKAMFQGMLDAGVKGATLTATEVESFGITAIEAGVYTMKDASGKEIDKGKYIVIWKREGGQWKLHRDIFNSSLPPAK